MAGNQVLSTLWLPELFSDASGRIVPESVYATGTAGSSGNTLVAAVAGKRILVLDVKITSTTSTATRVYFTSDSGGGARGLCLVSVPANNVSTPNTFIGPSPYGVLHTDVGEGLFFSVNAAAGADVAATYVIYTP